MQEVYYKLVDYFDVNYSKTENRLKSFEEIGYSNKEEGQFNPNIALYYVTDENEKDHIYMYFLNMKRLMIKDKTVLGFIKVKSGLKDEVAIEVNELKNKLELPLSSPFCRLIKEEINGKIIFTLDVFDVYKLDIELKFSSHIFEYAKNKLYNFNSRDKNQFLLTSDNIEVEIENIDEVAKIVEQNSNLAKSLSLYSDHGNKAIKRSSKEDLERAIETLKSHVADDGCLYTVDDIPELSDNKLKVFGNQIKIFTALLNNTIVEKILDHKIELPFFT